MLQQTNLFRNKAFPYPLLCYRSNRNIKSHLVRAKLPSLDPNSTTLPPIEFPLNGLNPSTWRRRTRRSYNTMISILVSILYYLKLHTCNHHTDINPISWLEASLSLQLASIKRWRSRVRRSYIHACPNHSPRWNYRHYTFRPIPLNISLSNYFKFL